MYCSHAIGPIQLHKSNVMYTCFNCGTFVAFKAKVVTLEGFTANKDFDENNDFGLEVLVPG